MLLSPDHSLGSGPLSAFWKSPSSWSAPRRPHSFGSGPLKPLLARLSAARPATEPSSGGSVPDNLFWLFVIVVLLCVCV